MAEENKCDICKNAEVTKLRKVIFMYHHAHVNVCQKCDLKSNSELESEWESSFATSPLFVWTVIGVFGSLAAFLGLAHLYQKFFG
jgi:hypothetical protein